MMPPHFGSSMGDPMNNLSDPNQQMNPMMMQMMALMQQNTSVMQQQQEFIRSALLPRDESNIEVSKSRSRSRPRRLDGLNQISRRDPHQESASQIGVTNYSELDSNHEKEEVGYTPENIRGASVSGERTQRTNRINQINMTGNLATKSSNQKRQMRKHGQEGKNFIQDKTMGIALQDANCKVSPNVKILEGDIITVER